ncbi:hypothetical protein LV779_39085 [Streptomyces thinghirensis]|nr:hypothetical protein [Streptomyces thinghirensis]
MAAAYAKTSDVLQPTARATRRWPRPAKALLDGHVGEQPGRALRHRRPRDPAPTTTASTTSGARRTAGPGPCRTATTIDASSTFSSIRSFYQDDPAWSKIESYLCAAVPASTFTYHRFWAQADIALAMGSYAELE